MATTRPKTETREASDTASADDERTGPKRANEGRGAVQPADPPPAQGVPANEGATDDERTGPGTGPMADGSPAPKGS